MSSCSPVRMTFQARLPENRAGSNHPAAWWIGWLGVVSLWWGVLPCVLTAHQASQPSDSTPVPSSGQLTQSAPTDVGPDVPATLALAPGEVSNIPVEGIERIAIGDPKILDATIISPNELLVQAQAVGTTNLILWDRRGKHVSQVEVLDRATETVETRLREMLEQLKIRGVDVKREGNALFLMGEVPRKEDLDKLERLLSAYSVPVTNLVTLAPSSLQPSQPSAPPTPSVKLTVQLIELTRDNTDKLGVHWSDTLTFTETPFSAVPLADNLHSLSERVSEAFRVGAFSRTSTGGGALSATLNLLASQGKARILAEPKLVAASGKEATAVLGVQVPVLSATQLSTSGVVNQSIEFKNTGVELKFKPVVLSDGASIQLGIDVKVSSIDKTSSITVQGTTVPGFRIRQTQTEIVTNSGQAVLISGLLQDEEKKNLSQVPAVGSIPVLGNLFRSTEFIRGRTELIVVVTPEIMVQAGEDSSLERVFAQEQALATAEVAAAVENPVLRYALKVQERIAKSLRYPDREKSLGVSAQVKLRVHLLRDGTLKQALVAESSGFEGFDQAAVRAAKSQSPFPMFPADLVQQDLWLELPVLFRP